MWWLQASVVWSKRSLVTASLHLEEAARCKSLNLASSLPSLVPLMASDQEPRQNPEVGQPLPRGGGSEGALRKSCRVNAKHLTLLGGGELDG